MNSLDPHVLMYGSTLFISVQLSMNKNNFLTTGKSRFWESFKTTFYIGRQRSYCWARVKITNHVISGRSPKVQSRGSVQSSNLRAGFFTLYHIWSKFALEQRNMSHFSLYVPFAMHHHRLLNFDMPLLSRHFIIK